MLFLDDLIYTIGSIIDSNSKFITTLNINYSRTLNILLEIDSRGPLRYTPILSKIKVERVSPLRYSVELSKSFPLSKKLILISVNLITLLVNRSVLKLFFTVQRDH